MFREIEREYTSADFKKEWNNIEIKGVEAILQEGFKEYYNIKNAEDYFGLPYTSTSSFAMMSNTNSKFEIEEGWRLEYFAITNNNMLIMIAWDEDENERYFEVEY
jgi:hypothetical protein